MTDIDRRLTVLVADDEEGPREQLLRAWESLRPGRDTVVAVHNGNDAWDAWLQHEPDLCLLDIRMPGMSGLDVAQRIDGRTPVILVTAYSEHAVTAFEAGAVDYVLKPVELPRLAKALERAAPRLGTPGQPSPAAAGSSPDLAQALQLLAERGLLGRQSPRLQMLQASVGREVRMIRVEDVVYFESDARYTRVVWQVPGAAPGQVQGGDALLRMPLKDLLPQLDPQVFWQVHRSVIVRCTRIAAAVREGESAMHLVLRDHPDRLPVSRPFQGLFKGQ
jgi:DNA-binding LytR/AlgR family response regulator